MMILVALLGILLRVLVGLYGYSGAGTPPMYGDYEAQRHWMEITYNLPISEWYQNTTENNLLYWGLDYPPLTAYHSWLCGAVAHLLNPSYVALTDSRGYESPEHKIFMRLTVLVAELLYFVPALALTWKKSTFNVTGFALLIYPGLILIDHGHFQFNCVSLGLVAAAYWALTHDNHILTSIFFCLALNYKQMTLYYALPFFAFLLNKCFAERSKGASFVRKFVNLGVTVLLTFAVIWSPFATSVDSITQVVRRLFPFDRGVFEDKVSNFWCVLNVFFKLKNHFTNHEMAMICALATLLSILPSCGHLLFRANKTNFLYSLFNCSMGFFLFSFQVHEKTILLVALPAMLLFNHEVFHVFWFLAVSSFSMLPLLIRDSLLVPYIALTGLFTLSTALVVETKNINFFNRQLPSVWRVFFVMSMLTMTILTILAVTVSPPPKYPDLFPLLISVFSAAHFGYFFVYFYWAQFNQGVEKKLD